MTDTTCPDCGHTHAGPELASICIGCPCPTRPLKAAPGRVRPPDDLHRFGCMTKDCGTARTSSRNLTPAQADSEARIAGWIIWRGTTRSGAQSTGIYCPTHSNRAAENDGDVDEETGWDAECDTCMTNAATDDPAFDGTEQAAEEWADDHICESHTRTLPPKTRTVAA